MTIDTSGDWWKGSVPDDLEEYLVALTHDDFPIDIFHLAKCSCGSEKFNVKYDKDEGAAMKTCSGCSKSSYICDSEEYWEDSKPNNWNCVECNSLIGNVGVGFSLYEAGGDIRRLYLSIRCTNCGVLGCYADWKVGYSPSRQLLEQV